MIKRTMTTYMGIAAQILLLESEPLLLLHMPRTATFMPKTAHFVAEAPLFLFTWFSLVLSESFCGGECVHTRNRPRIDLQPLEFNFEFHFGECGGPCFAEFQKGVKIPDIGPIIPVARGSPLQPEEWCAYMDNDGQIEDVDRLKERIFRGGIHEDIRREAWKFLLGYYDFKSTYEERVKMKEIKKKEYCTMKQQWQSMSEQQEKRFTEYLNRKHLVEKDVTRTDRTLEYYKGENNENVQKLFDILMTYCMYNFDLGYVQGMSDLLSPILMQMGDEIDTFWCFAGLMEMEQGNFELVQHFMKSQLKNLGTLLKFIFPRFYHYLERHDSGNLFFCFRWLLINFKRELIFDDTMTLWEVLWAQKLTPHFKLFICLAILEREKDYMMKNNFGFNEILKHINELSLKIDIHYMLARAESLCLQLQKSENLPPEIEEIVLYPDQIKNRSSVQPPKTENGKKQETETQLTSSCDTQEGNVNAGNTSSLNGSSGASASAPEANMETDTQRSTLQRTVDEVVELREDTKSVF